MPDLTPEQLLISLGEIKARVELLVEERDRLRAELATAEKDAYGAHGLNAHLKAELAASEKALEAAQRKAVAFDWFIKRQPTGCEVEIQGPPETWQLRWWFKQAGYRTIRGYSTLLDAIEAAIKQERG